MAEPGVPLPPPRPPGGLPPRLGGTPLEPPRSPSLPPRSPVPPGGPMPPFQSVPPQAPRFAPGTPIRPTQEDELLRRLHAMETKADEMLKRNEDLERYKAAMQEQLTKLEKALNDEREKTLATSLRTQEEKVVGMRVEASLKEIQEKLRRDQRERELEVSKSKTEAQLKEMEKRLIHERETWVEALKGQMAKRDLEDRAVEERFNTKLREIETRFNQERSRLSAKLDEKNKELDELKRQMMLKEEAVHAEEEKGRSQALILEQTKKHLEKAELDLEGLAKGREILEANVRKFEGVDRDLILRNEELKQARLKVAGLHEILRQKDSLLAKARLVLRNLGHDKAEFLRAKENVKTLEAKLAVLIGALKRLQKEKSAWSDLAAKKLSEKDNELHSLKLRMQELEDLHARAEAESRRLRTDKDALTHERDSLTSELVRIRSTLEMEKRAREELPVLARQIEALRRELGDRSNDLTNAQRDVERLKSVSSEHQEQKEKALRDSQAASRELERIREELKEDRRKYEETIGAKDVRLTNLKGDLDRSMRELEANFQESRRLTEELEHIKKDWHEADARAQQLLGDKTTAGVRYQEIQGELQAERQKKSLLEDTLSHLKTELDTAATKIKALEDQAAKSVPIGRVATLEEEIRLAGESRQKLKAELENLQAARQGELENLKQDYARKLEELQDNYRQELENLKRDGKKGQKSAKNQENPREEKGAVGKFWQWLSRPI